VPRLVSVNVGLPRDIAWNGRVVHTAIWKNSLPGRCRARRLNLDGDGQGDLAGHGGEQRAVFVYQLESYRHWSEQLNRRDFVHGQFGENFTVEGLPDDTVCIGDRYRIGGALFEVTQPRVTCYRVGIRMNETRMPALLTSSNRPGFYFRVLEEGEVGADDEIIKVGEATERMTVAEINALLYSPNHPRSELERALRIQPLSPGWRGSFEALLHSQTTATIGGNAGLVPAAAAHPVASGFRPVKISAIEWEGDDVVSLTMQDPDRQLLAMALPGQYVVLRLRGAAGDATVFRSYSLSGSPSSERYRVSVKLEPNSVAGSRLRAFTVGDGVEISLPRGVFTLVSDARPLVLLSAGIGVTPVLAMLYSLAESHATRQVFWVYQARDGVHHPFADEVRHLMRALPNARAYVCYSQPAAVDRIGEAFDAEGHLSRSTFEQIHIPRDAEVYLCGPTRFMADMKEELAAVGVARESIHVEIFNGGESTTPGVVSSASQVLPHPPKNDSGTGALVSFARSGITAHWNASSFGSLLEMAEACDVPVHWSCRAGVCHVCESGLVAGTVAYDPEPLDKAADGNLLICCSRPEQDVVVDL
jgi:ferredoxin-NADP reductase/MOSC domain-containing protein YiiM